MMMTDIRHLLDDRGRPAPGRPGRLARYLGWIVVSTFTRAPGETVQTLIPCRRRRGGRRCPGRIAALRIPDTGEVEWICPECGDHGVVCNWQGMCWDALRDADSALL